MEITSIWLVNEKCKMLFLWFFFSFLTLFMQNCEKLEQTPSQLTVELSKFSLGSLLILFSYKCILTHSPRGNLVVKRMLNLVEPFSMAIMAIKS